MKTVSADHAVERARAILGELNLGAVRGLGDPLNAIAKKQLHIPELIPQDLTQGAANDLDVSAHAMPEVIPAHPLDDIARFIDEHGALHVGMRRNNRVLNPHLPENL